MTVMATVSQKTMALEKLQRSGILNNIVIPSIPLEREVNLSGQVNETLGIYFVLYFCLDTKVPKNQGCLKLAKIIFVTLQENNSSEKQRTQTDFPAYASLK